MGMKVFSRLSKVFKSKSREPARQANDKVEAYMRAHHSDAYREATSAPVPASPNSSSAPSTDSRIASELDDLIADFENMAWPQTTINGAMP